jgi:uncharacterized protein
MRPLRAVGVYIVVVLLGGALIAPGLYALMQLLAGWMPVLESVASKPFPRYVNRSMLLLAVLGLWPLLRHADLLSWRAMGLSKRRDGLQQLSWGLMLGFLSLALVVVVVIAAGARVLADDHSIGRLLVRVFKAGFTALVVALVEEIVFRGALFGSLRKVFDWKVALLLSSVIYALVHFLERPEMGGQVGWGSGLVVLASMLAGLGELAALVPDVLNLTLVGAILGLAYRRLGTLHFSIGLHAGWIFWLKMYTFLTDDAAGARPWLFGTGKLINGWLVFLVLSGLLVLMNRWLVEDNPQTGWKERRLFS